MADNLGGVPDLTMITESTIAEGDRVAQARVYRGANTGRYPRLATGKGNRSSCGG